MKKNRQSSLDAISAITLSIVAGTWAASFIFIKVGLAEIPPITLAFIRFTVAFPVMVLITLLTGSNRGEKFRFKEDFVSFSILALTGVTLLYMFQFYSLRYTTASTGSILINTTVIFMAILSAAFLKEKLNASKIAGILVAFFGLFIIVSNLRLDIFNLNPQELLGDGLMIASAIIWAIYSIYSKKILQSHSPIIATTIVFGLGALYLAPFTLVEFPSLTVMRVTWLGCISILYLALVCSSFAYVAWNRALSKVETVKAGMFLYLIPIITTILSHFFLGEEIGIATVVGGAFILIGVYLTETT